MSPDVLRGRGTCSPWVFCQAIDLDNFAEWWPHLCAAWADSCLQPEEPELSYCWQAGADLGSFGSFSKGLLRGGAVERTWPHLCRTAEEIDRHYAEWAARWEHQ